jgi:hypothetical protein
MGYWRHENISLFSRKVNDILQPRLGICIYKSIIYNEMQLFLAG